MHTGSRQDQRLHPALRADYFRPDELTLAERLKQLLQWARQLDFVTRQGLARGAWSALLERDPSFVLAELAALPVHRRQQDTDALAAWDPALRSRRCLALAGELDGFYARLLACQEGASAPLQQVLRALTQRLQERMRTALAPQIRPLLAQASPGLAWHPHWGLEEETGPRPAAEAPPAPALGEHRLLWLSLCRVLEGLQQAARQQLALSLDTGDHAPAVGLLLGLTRLLQHSRGPLDAFHERLTRYYYGERLRLGRLPAAPAQLFLVLERQAHARQPVQVAPGARFVARCQGGSRTVLTCHGLSLSPLRVSRLLTLLQDHDPDISPERDYGLASTALAWQGAPPPLSSLLTQVPRARPPLGGGPDAQPARQGLAVASRLLELQEGRRRLQVHLQPSVPTGLGDDDGIPAVEACQALALRERDAGLLDRHPLPTADEWRGGLALVHSAEPALAAAPWLSCLLVLCLQARDAQALRRRLGRLFAVWLCATRHSLGPAALALLREHVARLMPGQAGGKGQPVDVDDPLALLYSPAPLERSLMFDRVFRGAWSARLSTAQGWLQVDEVFATHASLPMAGLAMPAAASGPTGLVLSLQLGAEQPAVVDAAPALHGAGWPPQPVLQLLLERRSRLFASSLLQGLGLEGVQLQVSVQGLRSLSLHNALGRLDPSKPFLPFGPLPEQGSYLMFSHPELARKPLQALQLHLQWQGLPTRPWAQHYAGYPDGPWRPEDQRAQVSVLSDGQWQSPTGAELPLLSSSPEGVALPRQDLDLAADGLLRLHRPAPGDPGEFSQGTRQGYFRLSLSGPSRAFGHATYPRLLTEVLTANGRRKRPLPLPLTPCTPTLAQVEVDYAATQRLAARNAALRPQDAQLLHITPFGLAPLHRLTDTEPCQVLQPWPAAGQLFLGLEGGAAEGALSLLFKLRESSAQEPLGRPLPTLRWQAWCGRSWVTLEDHRVLLDGTQGLLRTGTLVLDLPPGMGGECPGLPAGPAWLRLLADDGLPMLAGLQGVWTNGVLAEVEGPPPSAPLLPGAVSAPQDPLPGLGGVHQPWPSFGQQPPEDESAWIARSSERLRHRSRAAMPWDYERLVLQQFPEVQRVRCIPRGHGDPALPLTVVVVPALPQGRAPDGAEAPQLDAATLARIQRWLQERMPPAQALRVRNASYERLQVRCSLQLAAGEAAGERLRQLNDALRGFLSPWREGGPTTQFDWQVRVEDIEAFLRAQPGVARLGQASVLHIVRDDEGRHRLHDTATSDRLIEAAQPWSLALPTRVHLLELSADPRPQAQASGLSKLTLGSSFIIGRAPA